MAVLNTWTEILVFLGRCPNSKSAKSVVRTHYGDLIHREGGIVWAETQELIVRRHTLSSTLADEPTGKPVNTPNTPH
jgi:hypothetical protein